MNDTQYHIRSNSPEDTIRLGITVGKNLAHSSVIALAGELGSGKTCLTQGIAKGLGVPDEFYVTSPSYTLVNEYPGRLRLFHVDLYRLEGVEDLEETGLDEFIRSDDVTIIEWADKIPKILPDEHLLISISILDDQTRDFLFKGYGQSAIDLIRKLKQAMG